MRMLLAALVVLVVVSPVRGQIRGGGGWSTTKSATGSWVASRYDAGSLRNPYGAGSRYQVDGLLNPYSGYGGSYGSRSWRNPYASGAPRLYEGGKYRGKWSANRFDAESTANPYGMYGSPYSPDSVRNRFGAGSPYATQPIYVVPGR